MKRLIGPALAATVFAMAGWGSAQAADPPAGGAGGPIIYAVKCTYGTYTVLAGQKCNAIYNRVYCGKPRLFTQYNGFACVDRNLYKGQQLCRPDPSKPCG